MRRELLVSGLLIAAVAAVYWPVHSYPFVLLDDHRYIVENPYVRNGLTWPGIVHAFTGITSGNWHPLTMLSHMLDCQLFGVEGGAGWHHTINLALHMANTVLLFIVLRQMTGTIWRSALVAAFFGLHPLHVESVAWVAERKDVLSTLFFMLTLLAYHRYAQQRTIFRYAAVFGSLALGLMSKPMLVTAPFVLLLLDYWPLGRMRFAKSDPVSMAAGQTSASGPDQRPLSVLILEKIPLLVLATASAALTYYVQRTGGAMDMLGQEVPFWTRLGNAVFSYGQYLQKCFWPTSLSAMYAYANRKPIDVLIVGLALTAITVAAIRLARIKPFLLVGWFWYVGTLVPVIGLVQVGMQSMADRYTYIPLIGVFIIAAWGAAEFAENWPVRNKAIAAVAILTACGLFTSRQVVTWSSGEALFRNAINLEPYNGFAIHGLGMAYWQDGKLDDAQKQFEAMVKAQTDPTLHLSGGLEPGYRALGLLLAQRHEPRKALEQLDEAIRVRPQQPEPIRHKAWILATSPDEGIRDGPKAVEFAERALRLSSGKEPEYWDTLAAAQAEAGKFQEAAESAEKALQQARLSRSDDLIPGIQRRLALFQAGAPFHAEAERPLRP